MKMKKNIIILIFLGLAGLLFSEEQNINKNSSDDFYSRIIPLIQKNPEVQKTKINSELERIILFSEISKWLPNPFVDFKGETSGIKLDKNYYALNFSTMAGVSQNIPFGNNLTVYTNLNNSIFFSKQKEVGGNLSAGANLSIPAWFIAPSCLDDFIQQETKLYKHKKQLLKLTNKEIQKNIIIKTVSLLTNEKLLKRKIELIKKALLLSNHKIAKKEILFNQGKISVLEISEFEKKEKERKLMLFKLETEYANILSSLNLMGLSPYDIYESLEEWIDFLECHINNLSFNTSEKNEAILLQNKIAWLEKTKKLSTNIPKIMLGCNFDFLSKNNNENIFTALNNKNKPNVKWSVFMGFRINFNPFSSEYRLNRNFKKLKKIHNIDTKILQQNLSNSETQNRRILESLKKMLITAMDSLSIQEKYIKVSEEFYKIGKISYYDLDMQKQLFEEAKLNCLNARFAVILKTLESCK